MLATIYPSVTNFIDIFPLSLKCSTEAWFSKLNFHPIFKMGSDFYLGANVFQISLHHAECMTRQRGTDAAIRKCQH